MWTPAGRLPFLVASFVAAASVGSLVAGCGGERAGSYAAEVEPKLLEAGFEPWFPPEEGVEVGQIWSVDLAPNRRLAFARPGVVEPPPARPSAFLGKSQAVTFSGETAARVADAVTGADPGFRAALAAAAVDVAKVDFGETSTRELSAVDLDRPEVQARLPGPYRAARAAARAESPRHLCVAAVAEVAGMTVTWTVGDSAPVAAGLPRFNAALADRGELSVLDKRTVRLTVPASRRLAIGFRRLTGGAGFAAPAPAATVSRNLDHLATFDAASGAQLGREGGLRFGYADRAAFDKWLGGFGPEPGVDERVAELRAAVRAAPDLTDAGPPPRTIPGTIRLSHREVTTLVEVQRIITEEAVRRGLADVDEVRQKAQIGR